MKPNTFRGTQCLSARSNSACNASQRSLQGPLPTHNPAHRRVFLRFLSQPPAHAHRELSLFDSGHSSRDWYLKRTPNIPGAERKLAHTYFALFPATEGFSSLDSFVLGRRFNSTTAACALTIRARQSSSIFEPPKLWLSKSTKPFSKKRNNVWQHRVYA